jgi:hypothetical protein
MRARSSSNSNCAPTRSRIEAAALGGGGGRPSPTSAAGGGGQALLPHLIELVESEREFRLHDRLAARLGFVADELTVQFVQRRPARARQLAFLLHRPFFVDHPFGVFLERLPHWPADGIGETLGTAVQIADIAGSACTIASADEKASQVATAMNANRTARGRRRRGRHRVATSDMARNAALRRPGRGGSVFSGVRSRAIQYSLELFFRFFQSLRYFALFVTIRLDCSIDCRNEVLWTVIDLL